MIKHYILQALDSNGKSVFIDDVPWGKKCGCFCSECKGALIARHGNVKAHHFAHVSGSILTVVLLLQTNMKFSFRTRILLCDIKRQLKSLFRLDYLLTEEQFLHIDRYISVIFFVTDFTESGVTFFTKSTISLCKELLSSYSGKFKFDLFKL